jgi:hypothetical protein
MTSSDLPVVDHDEVVRHAEKHGAGDSSMFSSALGFMNNNKVRLSITFSSHLRSRGGNDILVLQDQHQQPLDEDEVTRAHDQVYNQNSSSGLSSNLLGSAAALQVCIA